MGGTITGISSTMTIPDKLIPIPLKQSLWTQLIDHFIDPDEGKTYKEVGSHVRCGTLAEPIFPLDLNVTWSPELRLSIFFSMILKPKLMESQMNFAEKILRSSKTKT